MSRAALPRGREPARECAASTVAGYREVLASDMGMAAVPDAGRAPVAMIVVADDVDATQHPVTIALSTTIVPRHGSHHVVVHGAGQAVAHGAEHVVAQGSQHTVTHGS